MWLTEKTKSKLKSKGKLAVIDLITYALLIGIVFLIYFPIINNFCDMLKSNSDLIDVSVAFIPKEPSFDRLFDTIKPDELLDGICENGCFEFGGLCDSDDHLYLDRLRAGKI